MDAQIFSSSPTLLISAFLLDLAVGDPPWLPHPVVLMGKVISCGEKFLRTGNPCRGFITGMALSLGVITLSTTGAWALLTFAYLLPASLAFIALAALASTTLATRGLLDAVRRIEAPLRAGDLRVARQKLSHIVGRETAHLNQDKVLCASLESLAESTCDGIVAPLFYLLIGGVPAAMAYKAISTLDSMIGYRSEKYFYFGKFAARLDDLVNWLPARLTACFMLIATSVLPLNSSRALRIAWRDRANHSSPNAGYPEATLAGAFGIRLGGPSIYFGREIYKPYLGDNLTPITIEMLQEGRVLCLVTAILSLAVFALLSTARS